MEVEGVHTEGSILQVTGSNASIDLQDITMKDFNLSKSEIYIYGIEITTEASVNMNNITLSNSRVEGRGLILISSAIEALV
jgi:hypothetical protein